MTRSRKRSSASPLLRGRTSLAARSRAMPRQKQQQKKTSSRSGPGQVGGKRGRLRQCIEPRGCCDTARNGFRPPISWRRRFHGLVMVKKRLRNRIPRSGLPAAENGRGFKMAGSRVGLGRVDDSDGRVAITPRRLSREESKQRESAGCNATDVTPVTIAWCVEKVPKRK